jgi:hypothetical protein
VPASAKNPGVVQFVVTGPTGDRTMDWFFEGFDDGVMLIDDEMGNIFVGRECLEEDDGGRLETVSKAPEGLT